MCILECKHFESINSELRPGNMGNIFLKLVATNVALQVKAWCCKYNLFEATTFHVAESQSDVYFLEYVKYA